jgi:hypothetical protein
MTSDTGNGDGRGNGRFACAAPDEQAGVACPCCGGTLSAATLEALLAQARAHESGKESGEPDGGAASRCAPAP